MTMLPQLPPRGDDAEWRRKAASLINLIVRRLTDVGASSDRPPEPNVGQQRFNTTTGKPEWWNGSNWVTW